MSDTPRTEAVWEKFETDLRGELEPDVEFSTLARQLERELNAANERISKLYDYVAALETGGDLMANELSFGYDVDLWNKARGEAKP